jgi:hypothetical protein
MFSDAAALALGRGGAFSRLAARARQRASAARDAGPLDRPRVPRGVTAKVEVTLRPKMHEMQLDT